MFLMIVKEVIEPKGKSAVCAPVAVSGNFFVLVETNYF